MKEKNWKVDDLIDCMTNYKNEAIALRDILLTTNLVEDRKWGQPCYTYHDKNVVMIGIFKNYIALSFLKGVLLKDSHKVLVSPGKNSKSVKFLKFTSLEAINHSKDIILSYIKEAITVEVKGLKIEPLDPKEQPYPQELIKIFNELPLFKDAFEKLTPGRRRAYLMFFNSAKQSQTIINRIEKYMDAIFNGKGMNEN
ncbi:MAG: DUF1801 domain-containing protein [Acholeplasmataceae bacterium]